ncbi:MAG TPA: nucleotidyltransferase domain-containing protein [Gemmatimonadales bacterium]|nr:nucleotidyltransferase domain-containing protein [Gemmatimonadales bacterium]
MAPDLPRLSLEQLRQAATHVALETPCRLVVLFGSAARAIAGGAEGRAPEDLDLGVLAPTAGTPLDTMAVTNGFIRALGVQHVDVADLGRAYPLLLMLVAQEGVPLFEATPGEFARFASLAVRRYADTRKFRELERHQLQDLARRTPTGR